MITLLHACFELILSSKILKALSILSIFQSNSQFQDEFLATRLSPYFLREKMAYVLHFLHCIWTIFQFLNIFCYEN